MTANNTTTFESIVEPIKIRIDKQLVTLIENYPSAAEQLKDAMHYSLLNGGKRMRPALISIVGDMLGSEQQDTDIAGMAIECIHAYSLIHDDLPAMDDDDIRRGKPTNHIKYGDATAILAGDALQTLAFEIIADHKMSRFGDRKRIKLVSLLAKASGLSGMCAGQSIDLISTGKDIELTLLSQLHQLKTGALIKASVLMAAALSPDTSPDDLSQLAVFADKIGLAFQVQDDILDVTGDSSILGKPQGSDVRLNKNTYVSHLTLQGAQEYLRELHDEALQALNRLPYNTSQLEAFTHYLVNRNH